MRSVVVERQNAVMSASVYSYTQPPSILSRYDIVGSEWCGNSLTEMSWEQSFRLIYPAILKLRLRQYALPLNISLHRPSFATYSITIHR